MSDQEEVNEDTTSTPLKSYVTVFGNKKDNKWLCNFGCRPDAYTGTYSRIRAHFLGVKKGEKPAGVALCSKITPEDREGLRKEEEDAREAFGKLRKRKNMDPLPPQANSALAEKQHIGSAAIKNMFKISTIEDADARVARFFYTCGISFNVARSPLFMDAVKAINEAPRGYMAPSSEKIRTKLLDKEKLVVENRLSVLKQDWSQYGVTIVSDGWSNLKNQPLINVLAVCGGKPIFLTAEYSSGEEKTGSYIANLLLKQIEIVGKYNIVQIVTDNASNCKAVGQIIMEKLPHIFWSGCMPHTLSLLMKDIAESKHPSLKFVGKCYSNAKGIIKYIRNHSSVLSMFRAFSSLEVIQVKKTRFGHHYIVIERLHKLRSSLAAMVLSDAWDVYANGQSRSRLVHDDVKKLIMDEQFWKDVKLVLSFTKPISSMIRFCDSDKAVIGEVYQKMEDMLGSVKDALSDHLEIRSEVEKLVMTRWERMNLPLHTLAYVLNPRYYSEAWLKTVGPGNKIRVKPHSDSFVQGVYLRAIGKLASPEDSSVIRMQLSDFTSNSGVFSRPEAILDRYNMPALAYVLATKVLSQIVNSSCLERVWSSFNYIHSVKRNKLNCDRAESLVYVHYNNRILTRFEENYEKKYKNWDRNTYEDFLEADVEAIEDQELTRNAHV